jgi:hypothetical protein
MADPFTGRVPIQTDYGSANSLRDNFPDFKDVPRPDITVNILFWISLFGGMFGLDHFYARSPWTGLAKLLTGGGLGLWWFWDWLQIWTEKEHIVNYGLSTPFDYVQGIAQGMITDKKTLYSQEIWSMSMLLGKAFGFMGFSYMMLGKVTAGMRILIIQVLTIAFAVATYYLFRVNTVGFIFSLIIDLLLLSFSLPITLIWFSNLFGAEFKGADGILNAFRKYTDNPEGPHPLDITNLNLKDFNKGLIIKHESEKGANQDSSEKGTLPFAALPIMLFGIVLEAFPFLKVLTSSKAASPVPVQVPHVPAPHVPVPKLTVPVIQSGGSHDLSVESQILGATVIALLGGGAMKTLIDFLTTD